MKLLLTGETISEERTKEIIFRTDSTIYNKIENNMFYDIFYDFTKLNKLNKYQIESVKKSLGFLNLNILNNKYFYNNDKEGPSGWSYLDGGLIVGTISFSNDIKIDDIINEFTILSKSFPFLNIDASILKDYYKDSDTPIFNIKIKDGNIVLSHGDITVHGCRNNSKKDYDTNKRINLEYTFEKQKDNDLLNLGLPYILYFELGNRIFNKIKELKYIDSNITNDKESTILKGYLHSLDKFITDEIEKNKEEIDIDKVVEKENNRKKDKIEQIKEEIINNKGVVVP